MNSIFTGAKMKSYLTIMQNCCKRAVPIMDNVAETKEDVLILELMMSYTTDVIGKFCCNKNMDSYISSTNFQVLLYMAYSVTVLSIRMQNSEKWEEKYLTNSVLWINSIFS